MSALVQYLNFLKQSSGENEKKEKSAELQGYEPSLAGALPESRTGETDQEKPIAERALASINADQNINKINTPAVEAHTSAEIPAITTPVHNPSRGNNAGVPHPLSPKKFTSIPRVLENVPKMNTMEDPRNGTLLDKRSSVKFARNTGIADIDGEIYVNTDDVELLGKLGFEYSASEYKGLEKTSEVLDVYSYIEKIAGVPKEVAKLIDSKKAFSAEYLKDMGYKLPKGYEVKGDLCCPVEKSEESSEKTAAANPAQTILITGHSGAGKTTLSRQLAEKLGIPVRRVDAHRGWDNYIRGDDKRWRETLTPGTKEHNYFTNLVNRATRDTLKNAPVAGIIEGTQLGHLSPEELAKFKAHIVVGGTRDQSIAQRIQRSVDKASKQGIIFSPEEMAAKKIKAEYVANFWEPGVEKFRKLPGVLSYNHTEHQIDPLVERLKQLMNKQASDKPGLWANIRAKRARGEKPAKPGDEDYPDKEQWSKLSKAAVAAWQRSEGKNPEGGLNAKGRASYKRETGGTLKAPVTESNPKGARAKRQNSFCSRMCGMKRVNTGSKAQSDPDSRINKSLRKWNCKCGEDHSSLFEKIACSVKEAATPPGSWTTPTGSWHRSQDSLVNPEGRVMNNTPNSQPMVENPYGDIVGNIGMNTLESLALKGAKKLDPLNKDRMSVSLGNRFAATKLLRNIAKSVPGVSAVAGISDAQNRLQKEDYTGAMISGLGAAGDVAQLFHHPVAKGVGLTASWGSTAANAARDINKYNNRPVEFRNTPPSIPQPSTPQNTPIQQPLQSLAKQSAADHPVTSSNIKAVGHDKKEKILEVAFHSGSEYKYKDVPRSLYSRLLKAKSPGKFLNKHIKKNNQFEYEKVAGMPEHIRKAIATGDKALLQAAQSRSVASRVANTAAKKRKLEIARLLGAEEPKIVQTAEALQKHFPFSVSHEFEQAKKMVDPSYRPDLSKYLGRMES